MRFVKSKISILVIVQLYIQSCSYTPSPIITLEPTSNTTTWLHGQEFVNNTVGNLDVSIAFYRAIDNLYIFDVEIKNLSDSSIVVSPEQAYYYTFSDGSKAKSEKKFAMNPEKELLRIDNSIAKENQSYSNEVTTDAVFSVLDFALTIATINKEKTDEEINNKNEMYEDMENSRIARDENHEVKVTNLTQKRDEWEISTLRKTTLEKESFIQGRIYFPITNNAKQIKITIPIGEFFFDFFYEVKSLYLY